MRQKTGRTRPPESMTSLIEMNRVSRNRMRMGSADLLVRLIKHHGPEKLRKVSMRKLRKRIAQC